MLFLAGYILKDVTRQSYIECCMVYIAAKTCIYQHLVGTLPVLLLSAKPLSNKYRFIKHLISIIFKGDILQRKVFHKSHIHTPILLSCVTHSLIKGMSANHNSYVIHRPRTISVVTCGKQSITVLKLVCVFVKHLGYLCNNSKYSINSHLAWFVVPVNKAQTGMNSMHFIKCTTPLIMCCHILYHSDSCLYYVSCAVIFHRRSLSSF